jgi:hypothetical protein
MPKLKTIVVIHTTSTKENANSAADFSLEIGRPGQDVTVPFPRNPNQRQRGKLDVYQIDVSQHDVDSTGPGFSLIMTIRSDDGWLPLSIYVLGHTEAGDLELLGDHAFWDQEDGWFDSGAAAEGRPSHEITGGARIFEAG